MEMMLVSEGLPEIPEVAPEDFNDYLREEVVICPVEVLQATPLSFVEAPGTEYVDGGLSVIRTIYNEMYDIDIPEYMLSELLLELELWSPGSGMTLSDLQLFFDLAETSNILVADCTLFDVTELIDAGYFVIVSADMGEILTVDAPDEDIVYGPEADYAFVIKEVSDSTVTLYALNGTTGDGIIVPLSTFYDAWEDGGYDVLVVNRSVDATEAILE